MPIRLGELGRRERIGKSAVTRLVARLEAECLITRVPDLEDGRSSLVQLTEEGRTLLQASSERADSYLAGQLAALPPEDRELLKATLPVLERLLAAKR